MKLNDKKQYILLFAVIILQTLGLGGQLGIEYDFSSKGVPLQVSLDTRPMFNLLSPQESRGYNVSACFSLRYSF